MHETPEAPLRVFSFVRMPCGSVVWLGAGQGSELAIAKEKEKGSETEKDGK